MKLIGCKVCNDIVALRHFARECFCGKSFGYYTDEANAVYGGEAIPIGILNYTLHEAISCQPEGGAGKQFTAFVIPKQCPTFERVERINKKEWTDYFDDASNADTTKPK
jgi:hypothetical protein